MHNVRLDDLVRYLYGELNAEQKKAVEAALETDPELRDKMKTLSVSKKRLDALSFSPEESTIENILEYSKSLKSGKS
jgi:hypothetical protein